MNTQRRNLHVFQAFRLSIFYVAHSYNWMTQNRIILLAVSHDIFTQVIESKSSPCFIADSLTSTFIISVLRIRICGHRYWCTDYMWLEGIKQSNLQVAMSQWLCFNGFTIGRGCEFWNLIMPAVWLKFVFIMLDCKLFFTPSLQSSAMNSISLSNRQCMQNN